ncbi:MAG: MATE family efflux transporter, partial [Gammaproteobacteria bacterium]|nr:MATE family efflux transporter [Gammaproteobacteria bacterium]
LVGKAIGMQTRAAFKRAVKLSLQWSLVVALLFTAAYGVTGKYVINLLTDITPIREAAYLYLPWMVLSPLVSVWSFLYDGVYIGATRAREMRDTMLISTFLLYVPAWYVLQPFGNHGLWAAFIIFMAARGVSMSIVFWYIESRKGFAATG